MNDTMLSTVCLRDAEGELEARFMPGAGMLCCSLRHRGEELLAQNAGVETYVLRGKTMGIPLLYPWANRLAAFNYDVAGRAVVVPHDRTRVALDGNGLPIHGVIGGRLEWEPVRSSPVAADSLVARLSWNDARPELFEIFPFRHDLEYRAVLAANRLTVSITVHASAEDYVPVAFGFHPYLSLPGIARESWQVQLPAMRHLALDAQQIPSGPERVHAAQSFALGELELDDGFDQVAQGARFEVTAGGRAVTLELIEGYPCAQVFARRGGEFICFEPMTAPANALVSGSGLRVLAPGERLRATFAVSVQDGGGE